MTFWIIVAVILAVALVLLLLPLLRASGARQDDDRGRQNIAIAREQKAALDAQLAAGEIDQAAYDAAYRDLQTALALELERAESVTEAARGKWMALVVLLAVPCASIALYLAYGEYRVIENPQLAQAAAPAQTGAAPQMSMEEMVAAIEARVAEVPDDAEAWFMLGRTRMAQQDYDRAVEAFRQSDALLSNQPGILFALADAIAMQNNGSLQGEPTQLVERGLQIEPRFPNGLWLAGLAAEQRQDFGAAHRYWSLLLPLVSNDAQSAEQVRAMLGSLEQRDPSLAAAEMPATARPLTLEVTIDDELRARAGPDTALFVYAKAMQGPPMPLAVKRLQVKDLPVTLTLSDADAMMPALKLSAHERVVVGARVSFSGNPVAQSGDFFTELDAIDNRNPPASIQLTIDQVKP